MSLATDPRYDRSDVSTVGDHAVVIGAGMAGLAASRVLADGFEIVTLIDQDPLPDTPIARQGVPQANHIHVLLNHGRTILEDLFPGYVEEVVRSGGLLIDMTKHADIYHNGGVLAKGSEPLSMLGTSRPLFERFY